MKEDKKNQALVFEEELAHSLGSIAVNRTEGEIEQNGYATGRYLAISKTLAVSEAKIIKRAMKFPDGWTAPLFDITAMFKVLNHDIMLANPSINAHHFDARIEMMKEAAKRPPPINMDTMGGD